MNIEFETLRSTSREWDLSPHQPPIIEDDLLTSEAWVSVEAELEDLRPHGLDQYCECCRRLARMRGRRPIYIGYSILPLSPLGACQQDEVNEEMSQDNR